MEIKNKELKAALCQIKGAALRLYKEPAVIILFFVFVLVSVFSHDLYAIILWLLLVLGWYWGVAVFGAEKPGHPEKHNSSTSDAGTKDQADKNEETPAKEEEGQQGKKPAKKDTAQVVEKEEAKAKKTQNEPKEQTAPKAENKDSKQ